jgi:hypothetical protein
MASCFEYGEKISGSIKSALPVEQLLIFFQERRCTMG